MVEPSPQFVPPWLIERLIQAGGSVPFTTYMEWVLHDPGHGAYGAGRLRLGPRGDFATAPSLGPDFAALLAVQLADWLVGLPEDQPLTLVEAGPGEGSLAADLAFELQLHWPQLAQRLSLVLVEPNPGMADRQRQRLAACPLAVQWSSFAELAQAPVCGVVVAHEVLDALAVERIVWHGGQWCQQRVLLEEGPGEPATLRLVPGGPLPAAADGRLHGLGLLPPSPQRSEGWCSELHPGVAPWLSDCGQALSQGLLLVVDYALEAWRYYAPHRCNGTLMAYLQQQASADPFQAPGAADLTAHLCIDSLVLDAQDQGWWPMASCRQGEALLALGLAQRLHSLQQGPDLAGVLARREALLRLVDPSALGDFRWLAFARGLRQETPRLPPLFSQEPALPATAPGPGLHDQGGL